MTPTGTMGACLSRRRPTSAVIRKPIIGSTTIAGISRSNISAGRSLAHRVVLVDERRPLVAEDRDDDRKADRGLRGGDRHHHQRDHRAGRVELLREGPERDDREVDRIEHQLDAHQHADRVAAGEEAEHPHREQDGRDDEVGVERVGAAGGEAEQPQAHDERAQDRAADQDPDHSVSFDPGSRLARNTPPMTAASSSTPTISNGRTHCEKRTWATAFVATLIRSASSPQSVARIARTVTIARRTAASAAGAACVWKTSREGASFVSVSMIAKRIRTLIAPM